MRCVSAPCRRLVVALALFALSVAMAGASARSVASGHITLAGVASTDAAGTVWLCRPGIGVDPCTANLDTTVVQPDGTRSVQHVAPAANPRFDCFYVYPTVSLERSLNADLQIQPAETATAIAQASRFSQVCQVWAPMYRQQTLLAIALGASVQTANIAYQSLLAGWRGYLANDNQGRPIIFIGHSQGAAILIRLLRSQVDSNPALRRRVVSAIILGGNVSVPSGKEVGASFRHMPACRSTRQTGCVIAYSSFPSEPPADSLFGRPGQGVSLLSGQTATTGVHVVCVNPAAMGGGTARLDAYFPTADLSSLGVRATTPWVEYPSLVTGTCTSAGGATWLDVAPVSARAAAQLRLPETGGPQWGYHVEDVNLALGNLVHDLRQQEMAYQTASNA